MYLSYLEFNNSFLEGLDGFIVCIFGNLVARIITAFPNLYNEIGQFQISVSDLERFI